MRSMISRKMSSGCANSGIAPGAVLVVVLHAQDDAALLGVLDRSRQPLERAGDARRRASCPDSAARSACGSAGRRAAASGRSRPAAAATWRARSSASGCVKSGEKQTSDVGWPVSASAATTGSTSAGVERSQEAVVVLDAFAAERRRLADPGQVVAGAGDEVVEPALGEDRDAWVQPGMCVVRLPGAGRADGELLEVEDAAGDQRAVVRGEVRRRMGDVLRREAAGGTAACCRRRRASRARGLLPRASRALRLRSASSRRSSWLTRTRCARSRRGVAGHRHQRRPSTPSTARAVSMPTVGVDRADVDDRSAAACLHRRERFLHQDERRPQVDRHHAVPERRRRASRSRRGTSTRRC